MKRDKNQIFGFLMICLIAIITFTKNTNADIGKETGLEIPRYVSLKSDDSNIRVGPSKIIL